MRKSIFVFLTFFISSIFAQIPTRGEKIYLHPENIQVKHDKIYVEHSGRIHSVTSISVDQGGVFTMQDGVYVVYCQECDLYVDLDNQAPECPHPWFIRN